MREELGYIQECDLDLILMLDARAGGPLTAYLVEKVGLALPEPRSFSSCRSTLRSSDSRETDVEISWPGGILLIEDKVDARFQPGQPESYATEVARRTAEGERIASVLIAPSRRRAELEQDGAEHFTAFVTCEELVVVGEAADDPFGRAAAIVFRAAEEAKPSGGRALDLDLSTWGDEYRMVIASVLPEGADLTVGPGSLRAEGREFAQFLREDHELEWLWKFGQWVPNGQVRMELAPGVTPRELPTGFRIEQKPEQCWVIADAPGLDLNVPASDQAEEIAEAVAAAVTLRRWGRDVMSAEGGASGS